ncbi:translation elongation factor P (EF-P) [Myxococcus fulvus]|uniref:Elongation factor P n=1 Tax=Myxococcus fulvus TaxID=33 RepID=A0A511TH48_MYXFU|nr:elongation factor P [Myxococcus fulvus]GEN13499.1 elongation factor P [Myxococcus fulvus]SET36310.1 translation elongation factor P (EF-P) [Myxococcus fulvus]
MANTADIRRGLFLKYEGALLQVEFFQHVKPGKGAAFVRTKLRNVITGEIIERTFHADEQLETAQVDRKNATFQYQEGTTYIFMDPDTYDQYQVSEEVLGQARWYLDENTPYDVVFHEGRAVAVEPPTTVVREVVDTEPSMKQDTSGVTMKPARISSGLEVQVPLFCAVGDKIKIDTRTGDYLGRIDERASASSP